MKLTERELDVLACLLIGEKSYNSTAKILKIRKATVNTYVRRICAKAECETIIDLTIYLEDENLRSRYRYIEKTNSSQKRRMLTWFLVAELIIFVACFVFKTFK